MKKYKVKITKEKVIIKPLPGHEIDQDLICVLNRHYEHNGVFKPIKKELPKTWEEFLRTNNKCYPTVNHFRIPLKYNEAFEALAKLIELRDYYNDGWVPDWDEESIKYDICYHKCNIITGGSEFEHEVLAFKTVALRDEFLTNFRELIKNAKPLL